MVVNGFSDIQVPMQTGTSNFTEIIFLGESENTVYLKFCVISM